ncbi:MAG TPA: DUF2845 domain-containing protein [Steroidobacteraceae bacterium]|jgi:hypothetical protein|nr:DUF2845 domain-containing protein [Steroidobacteraceae bacterium]
MKIAPIVSVLLVIVPGVCMSDGFFRCGSSLVSADVSLAELRKKCGPPSSKNVSTHDVRNSYGVKVGTSTTQIWRYDRGYSAPPMVVTIIDGHVQSIDEAK